MLRSRERRSVRRRGCLLAGVLTCALLLPSIASANTVLLTMARLDDFVFPLDAFGWGIEIELTVGGVTNVAVTVGSGTSIPMEFLAADGVWEPLNDLSFTSLAALKTVLHGTWTVQVTGTNPSTTTFTVDANSLVDSNFFPTATGLSPANGATGVSSNPTLSWSATGIVNPWGLGAFADDFSGLVGQEALSLTGEISLTDTSWVPPLAIPDGQAEWGVFYIADPDLTKALVGDPQVNAGGITWLTSPLAPAGWPAGRPALALLSETIVAVTVPEPEEALQSGAALAALGLLAWLRSRRRSPGDAVA